MSKMPQKVKKYLKTLTHDELIKQVEELYGRSDLVRDYYNTKMKPTENIIDKYKKILQESLSNISEKTIPNIVNATKTIIEFEKIAEQEHLVELIIFYIRNLIHLIDKYGDVPKELYDRIESMYEKALKIVKANEIEDKFQEQFEEIVEIAENFGEDFGQKLSSIYKKHFKAKTRRR